ncbi:hypothetical protein D3C78_859500 [compost metagenome]
MHGDAGRLVEHDQRLVLVDDGRLEALQQPLRQRLGLVALGQAQRRHPHHIARLQLVLRLDPALVHAHFALAQDAINQCFGNTFQLSTKKVVDALPGDLRLHFEQLDASGDLRGSCHARIIAIFPRIEALNDCCYSPGAAKSGIKPAPDQTIRRRTYDYWTSGRPTGHPPVQVDASETQPRDMTYGSPGAPCKC